MPSLIKNNSLYLETSSKKDLIAFLKSNKYTSHFIICDSNTLKHCLTPFILACPQLKEAEIIELEPGEESKDLQVLTSILQTLTDFGADKKSLIINLGGGVISDIGGFAASIYKRGIDFINVPTSLLAIADASVGGKTGLNFSGIKNHIGTITQPKGVFIDPVFLKTLPQRHLINGFAEIIKAALVQDKKFFNTLSSLKITPGFNNLSVISQSIIIKNRVVKKDPAEKGLRKILNFGHTVGHAIESLYMEKPLPLLHGEAIAIGMVIESYLCLLLKRISKKEFDSICSCLALNFNFHPLLQHDMPVFFNYFNQDKKHLNKAYMFALLNSIGKCDPEVKVSSMMVEKAIQYYNKKIAHVS
ncbi:MAG: 3-dehydroquinate synthase [Bacteroidetes bacterium]|nr:3-dehydroquinate synthase [Bacteroidota bacterium]